ncbi:ABC transporter permease [Fusobacterium necrophorum]|uniref:ABC transporter permease n=1 Tax=Fusobacterium necrophorum TaxID=859 RepID=UPI00370E9BB8
MKVSKKQVIRYLILFFLIISINFILPRLMKVDPFLFLSSEGADDISGLSEKQIEQYFIYYGLDKPLWQQYLYYLKSIFTGNMGFSISKTLPVSTIIFSRIPWTIGIVLCSLTITILLGISFGTLSAYYKDNLFGRYSYLFFVILSQIPPFLIGFGILVMGASYIPSLPIAGGITPFLAFEWNYEVTMDILKHAILPILTLVIARVSHFFMLMRGKMIVEIEKRYVFIEKAKGFGDIYILCRHCLKNAITPLITEALLSIALILQGSLIVENVFEYPGIGKLLKEAVFARDYPLLQGIFLFMVGITLGVSFISEIIKENEKMQVHV